MQKSVWVLFQVISLTTLCGMAEAIMARVPLRTITMSWMGYCGWGGAILRAVATLKQTILRTLKSYPVRCRTLRTPTRLLVSSKCECIINSNYKFTNNDNIRLCYYLLLLLKKGIDILSTKCRPPGCKSSSF